MMRNSSPLKRTALIIFGFVFSVSLGQEIDKSEENKFKIGVLVAQGSENSYTQSLPAKFVSTFPSDSDKEDSYSINGFVSLDIYKGVKERSPFKLSAVFEKHKNTLIEKEQDVTQLGVKVEMFLKQGDEVYPTLYHIPSFSFKQSEDRVNDKRGLQYLLYYSVGKPLPFKKYKFLNILRPNVFYPNDKRNNIPTEEFEKDSITVNEYERLKRKASKIDWSKLDIADFIQIKHTHSIGIEHVGYEKLTMGNISFNLRAYPFSGILYSVFKQYGVIELKYAVTHREELSSSNTSLFVGTLLNRGVAINYKFNEKGTTSLSIGYDHFQGGNPLKGLANNEYGQLSIGTIIKL